MHPELKTVIELQQVDLKIAELTTRIDGLPAQIQTLQTQLDEFIHAHEERKKRLTENQKERRELESEIKLIQEKIAKHKDQLYQVKTNEQYRAMLKEIGGEETNIRTIEDQVLEKMMEAGEIQKLIEEAASRLEGEKARVAGEIKELETERQTEVDEREHLRARRKELEGALSEPVLSLYERIRSARGGIAVAQVREGLCTVCNVLLRPQMNNEVLANDAVLTCENCGRIIYYVAPAPAETGEAGDRSTEAAV